MVYSFVRIVIVKYHKLGWLVQHTLIVSWFFKLGVWDQGVIGLVLSEGFEGTSGPCQISRFWQFSGTLCKEFLGLYHPNLCLHLHILFPLSVSGFVLEFPLFRRTLVILD